MNDCFQILSIAQIYDQIRRRFKCKKKNLNIRTRKSFLIIYFTKSELIKRLFKCRTELFEKLSNCGATRSQSSEEMNILWPFGEPGLQDLIRFVTNITAAEEVGEGQMRKETKPSAYLYYWQTLPFVQLVPKNPWLIKNQPNTEEVGGRANAERKPNVISTSFNQLIQNILITGTEQLDKKRSLANSELANFFVLLLSASRKIANTGTAGLFLLPVCLIYAVDVYCLITFFYSFALYFPIYGCSFNCLFCSFICGAVLFC